MRRFRFVARVAAALLGLAVADDARVAAQDAPPASDAVAVVGHWQAAEAMGERREYGGGVVLQDGRILAVSGHPLGGQSIATAELYDPRSGKWSPTGSLRKARNSGNSATLLRDGRVLIAGGHSNREVIRGAELFDPATGKWHDAGTLGTGRDPVATLLDDGRVLVAGGIDWYTDGGKVYPIAELFDPATGQWTATGRLGTARNGHRAVLLDDGRVLAVAGYGPDEVLLASAELYDPATGAWHATGELPAPRAWFSLAKLLDGRVLLAGGYGGQAAKRTYLASVLLYDPQKGVWTETEPMKSKRAGFAMIRLPDGRVLVSGGVAESGLELTSAELFDPQIETWQPAAPMTESRRNHRAALLPDGRVLVIGGGNFYGAKYLRSCEIFSLR